MARGNKKFVRHFRIYFKNNHPAYIVDEEGNMYVFHKVTHSKTSGGKKNWEKENPLKLGGERPIYMVKREQRDKKNRFSLFKLDLKPGIDVSFPEIKAGSTQSHQDDGRANIATGKNIKPKVKVKNKKK